MTAGHDWDLLVLASVTSGILGALAALIGIFLSRKPASADPWCRPAAEPDPIPGSLMPMPGEARFAVLPRPGLYTARGLCVELDRFLNEAGAGHCSYRARRHLFEITTEAKICAGER